MSSGLPFAFPVQQSPFGFPVNIVGGGVSALGQAPPAGRLNSAIKGVLFEGDSLTAGVGTNTPSTQSYPAQFATLTGLSIVNQGTGGDLVVSMDTQYDANDGANYNAGSLNTLVLLAGTNDIWVSNASAATVQSAIQSLCVKAKTTGFIVGVCTILPRVIDDAGKNATRIAVNTWLKANYTAFADYLFDGAAIPVLQDPSDTTYFTDGLHLTAAGYGELAYCVRSVFAGVSTFAPPVPTTYALAGPNTVTTGQASANFTVSVSGKLSGSVVITPSDGGGGGTFTPTTVTLGTSLGASATFKYTAGNAGSKTISVTNNGGLTNPASKNVTASAPAGDQFLQLTGLTGLTETPDGSGFDYVATSNNGYSSGQAITSVAIPANADGYIGATITNGVLSGLKASSASDRYFTFTYGMWCDGAGGNYNAISGGNAGDTGDVTIACAADDVVRYRRTGSTIVAEVSKNAGSTWTTFKTWTGASTAALYCGFQSGGVSNPIKKPFGSPNVA